MNVRNIPAEKNNAMDCMAVSLGLQALFSMLDRAINPPVFNKNNQVKIFEARDLRLVEIFSRLNFILSDSLTSSCNNYSNYIKFLCSFF